MLQSESDRLADVAVAIGEIVYQRAMSPMYCLPLREENT